jgi:hypothetical protein
MSYTPLGDKTVQGYIDVLSANTVFDALSEAQQIQYINFEQQEVMNICKRNSLESFKSNEDSYIP